MTFQGFTSEDFDVFDIPGLEERMVGIRERIQPKFREIGEQLSDDLTVLTGKDMYLHIARHARRKVNPPVDTWLAFSPSKRGYKQYPHFQIGLFDDRVFIWLACIYEIADKHAVADRLLADIDRLRDALPEDAHLSTDHMIKDARTVSGMSRSDWESCLHRFRNVKNAELLIGRQIDKDEDIVRSGERFIEYARQLLRQLAPIYKLAAGGH